MYFEKGGQQEKDEERVKRGWESLDIIEEIKKRGRVERERGQFFPLMIDPSVLLSADHLQRLKEAGYELYLPGTLYRILKEREERISNILMYFYWPWRKRLIKMKFELMHQFIEEAKPKPYEAVPGGCELCLLHTL
jgi:hypothetical protein